MNTITLKGGPRDGSNIDGEFAPVVLIPEAVAPLRQPEPSDRFEHDRHGFVRWCDDDLNVRFIKHRYDARTGDYLGTE